MKHIILILVFVSSLMAGVVKSPLISIDEHRNIATIKIKKIDIGMSGFISHNVDDSHSVILKNIEVISFDKESEIATLKMTPYDALRNNSLPKGKWKVKVGDTAILAFGYTRGVLIAPNDEIYYRIIRSIKNLQWVHPDIFATILSFNGHPTPLREDFTKLSIATSVGLIFFFLDEKLYTADSKSFKILNITDAPLKQSKVKLPFFSRVDKIEANWFGDGSDELETYESYYFGLLSEANPNNKELKKAINNFNTKAEK
ncbi:plasminogen-binding N-terminal domain-containing protein [Sulfurimonas sp.]|uniref:plasminogen-binding N-terminal domain-containing protein n=1 Tax=Sulfurimonas sp. TaxID=2022749 RepID=UPI002B4A3F20|nr:plasminogen-binding N-terminal domain-containing protein [Sulfurimonas sp.]